MSILPTGPGVDYRWILVLRGLTLPEGSLRFETGAEVRPIATLDRTILEQGQIDPGITHWLDFADTCVLTTPTDTDPRSFHGHGLPASIYYVLSSFAVQAPVPVGVAWTAAYSSEFDVFTGAPFRITSPHDAWYMTAEDGRALVVFGNQLADKDKGAVRIALSRLNYRDDGSFAEDRFIDLWIALEALFSPLDAREVTYRLALRIAYFIGGDSQERERIYKSVVKLYALRSKVVHGKTRHPWGSVVWGSTPELDLTREYLRRALIKIVTMDQEFKAEALDILISRGAPE